MRIALVTGGQPRFTRDFVDLMNQLRGFESADIYMTLWNTEWARTEDEARIKIEKILLPGYNLAKIQIVEEPEPELPPHDTVLSPPKEKNVAWWYKRQYLQSSVLSRSFDMIDQAYDAVIRFRLDGSLDRNLDVSSLDIKEDTLLLPNNSRCGFPGLEVCDQFAIGSQSAMKFYFDFGKQVRELVPEADPQWAKSDELDSWNWTWGGEHLIGYYMKKHGVPIVCGDYGVAPLNRYGRSKFTDKHYHQGVAQDPTE
jgi:hypothetical protein